VAPVPFLLVLRRARPRRGFVLGLAFGAAFYGVTLSWILLFGELAWTGITLVSAISTGVFGLLAPAMRRPGRPVLSAFGLAALWTTLDWVRGMVPFGGFTWGSLGVAQVDNRITLRLASVAGVWGVTFAIAAACALIAAAVGDPGGGWRRAARAGLAIALALVPAAIPFPGATGRTIDVAATVVDVRPYRVLGGEQEDRAVAAEVVRVHRTIADGPRPDLIVWGESALDPGATTPEVMADVRAAIADVGSPVVGRDRSSQGSGRRGT
jgi:apolipoprotein N-acyltransferase